jgi:hypothetical protein
MKCAIRIAAGVLVGISLMALGPAPALPADQLCSMGGCLIKAEIDKGKALAWAKELRRVEVDEPEGDAWTVLALSRADSGIAVFVAADYVFFGVPGRGGETYPRDIARAFGDDLGKLREAVKQVMEDLRSSGAVKIGGEDVRKLSAAAGLGILEKDGGDWKLRTEECQAVDLPTSGL